MHVSAPKGKLPADLRAQIAERKAEILTLLRQGFSTKRIAAPPITPRARSEPAPLSFAQERLWFLEQLEPESSVYNICRASRLFGNLNASALEASLNEIISRHETLRTAFRLVDGRPVQVVQPIRNISIEYVDLRARPDDERDVEIQRRIKAESECLFDLSSGPSLRSTLLRAGDQEHALILMTHHSASDGWSMGILTRELWTLYEAFSNGKPSPLELLPVQYSDYSVWQRNWLQSEMLDAQLTYWKRQLKDLTILSLPSDQPRAPRQSFRGARFSIALAESLTRSINEISNCYTVTPFMTLLAAFQVLLFRYMGQEDVVLGSPIANRRRPEIEGLIGFFVNTLVLRADLSGNPSFRELLTRVKDTCVAADANQDLPFEKLVQELQPERDLSRNPLFQVMFVLQNATSPFRGIAGLRVEPIELETTRSPLDLSLFLREREGKYIGYIEYSTDLFDRDRIERMAGHFQTLLDAIVADPDQSIATLPILTEGERHQILVEWNDTAADYPKNKCIHQLFEEQVDRTPDAVALEFEDKQVTYRELNRKANQLAHYLISLGIGPEKLVGICVERSIDMVVGLLAILKTGGAYVPLDPSYPNERLQFMMEDARISAIMTKENYLDRTQTSTLSAQHCSVCLDRDLPIIERQSSENLTTQLTSHNLAYVIYTSGSAGQPKGVQIEHRSLVNCLLSIGNEINLTLCDAWLGITTISFDIASLELYLPLMTGAKLILTTREESADTTQLISRIKASRPTVLQATPSLWKLLLDNDWKHLGKLSILCGGETLPPQLADRLACTADYVWNLYGPTETTIWSTMYPVKPGNGPVYIGRPIANTYIYILDAHMQPVPMGVHGDFYVGGDGLARGYLNRPELTAERFVANPFSDDPRSRLYRTGDRARYHPDGNIEFLGREDNQVKIRGHRIELGEIEAVLNQHPAVKESVVVAVDGGSSDSANPKFTIENPKWLIAYFVTTAQKALSTELRGVLKAKLPDYMIPSAFVELDSLPLTPNGKIDRSALPSPFGATSDHGRVFIEPRTEMEELVTQAWREVLRIENLSIDDNFFELGGHSLLATQIIARLRETFDREIPLSVLFDNPTVANLSGEIEKLLRDGDAPALPPIVTVARDGPLPLSMNQEHLWRFDQMMPGTNFFNMPYVYRLSGELDVETLEKALREIIRRHEALRTVFEQIDGRPVQIIRDGSDFQLQTVDFRSQSPGDASHAAAEHIVDERSAPFDLATGPLRRVKLLRLTETDALLLITVHHIISDHWSMQVFRGELIELYRAIMQGCPSSLPEPKIQFGDYALWERQLLDSGQFSDRARYWKNQVMTDRGQSQFRVATESDSEIVREFHRQVINVDASLLSQIKRFAVQQNCTPFTVVLSGVFVMSYLVLGEPEILCGTLMSNRRSRETEGTIGHFLNTVVLRARLSPADTFERILKRVRVVSLAGHAKQEFPFEQLKRDIENKSGRDSSIRVLFNYQKRAFSPIYVAGLKFASFPLPKRVVEAESLPAAYDLIFDLKEMSTSLTGTVNVVNAICKQSGARSANIGLEEILSIMVSESSKSLMDL